MKVTHLDLMKKLLGANGPEATEIYNQICSLTYDCSAGAYVESIFNNYYTAVAYQFSQNQNPQNRRRLEGVIHELEKLL